MVAPAKPRILLLELATPGSWIFPARWFPFVAGFAERSGWEWRWLCFGAEHRMTPHPTRGVEFAIAFPEADLATLREEVARLRPTHVLANEPVCGEIRQALAWAGGAPDLRVWPDVPEAPWVQAPATATPDARWEAEREGRQARTDWLLAWAGEGSATPGARAWLVEAAPPRYDALMANPQARVNRPHLTVMGGFSCDYRARLADNPLYAGLDLTGCGRDAGCAFCTAYTGPTSDPHADPVELALAQLKAIRDTSSRDGRDCGLYDLYDIRLFGRLEAFFDGVLALGLSPAVFSFSPRADRFLAAQAALERVLPRLAGSGHVLRVARMGAESLVDAENARLNKGLIRAQLDAAAALWLRLRREFPASFEHDGTWAWITVTPWTTLEALLELAEAAVERACPPSNGWPFTPVELRRGSPIHALAARDGLLTERFEDPALYYEATLGAIDTASMAPWRFLDPRAALGFGLMVRAWAAATREEHSDQVLADDPTHQWLVAELARRGLRVTRPEWLVREVLAGLLADGAQPDPRQVLAQALNRVTELQARAPLPDPAQAAPGNANAGGAPEDALAHRLMQVLCAHLGAHLAGVTVQSTRTADGTLPLDLELSVDGTPYRLQLSAAAAPGPCVFAAGRFKASHDASTPFASPLHARRLRLLVEAFDRALPKVPRLLAALDAPGPGEPHRHPREER
jgi:hypothetical protein